MQIVLNRKLTDEAQADSDDFALTFRDEGCTCFISPPCSYCCHPGNPISLEDEYCWKPDDAEDVALGLLTALQECEVSHVAQ